MSVYDLTTREMTHKIQLFASCFKIIGITLQLDGQLIMVQTEKTLKILKAADFGMVQDFGHLSHDKIVHSQMLSEYELLTVNAHNYTERWNL